jgi:hypothetical protein
MCRFAFRLAVALLTFTVGVAATTLWFFPRQLFSDKNKFSEKNPTPVVYSREKTLVAGTDGNGISKDGYQVAFTDEIYSDGTSFHQISMYYNSPKRANAELQKRLEEAVEIIGREPVTDKKGHQIGERVIATFASDQDSSTVQAELLWTENSRYVSQKRSSLEEILNAIDSHH